MKLIQLNIWQGRLILNVTRFLERNPPDILCLQEACSSPDTSSFSYDNIEALQRSFDFPHLYFSPTTDFRLGGVKVAFGNAILSRFPLEATETVFTTGSYHADNDLRTDIGHSWNFQHAIVSDGRTKAHIINHHGYWTPGVKTGSAETTRQMDMIADYAASLDGGVIFTGDLNLLPVSPSLARLNKEMINLCITRGVKTTRNFTSYNAEQVCDFIFVNTDIQVNDFRVHDDVVSDHSMLALIFGEG